MPSPSPTPAPAPASSGFNPVDPMGLGFPGALLTFPATIPIDILRAGGGAVAGQLATTVGGSLTSGAASIVSFVFQTVGSFLTSFVRGSVTAAGQQLAGGHLIGLVVAVAVVLVLF